MSARLPWANLVAGFHLRTAGSHDQASVERFLAAMDREGLYQRHFAHGDAPNRALLDRLDRLDNKQRAAVLAIAASGEVVGHGEYVAEEGTPEFAFLVLPACRASGIGTRLLHVLVEIASASGHPRMQGLIQAGNRRALDLVRRNGFSVVPDDDATVVIVSRYLSPSRAPGPNGTDTRDLTDLTHHDSDRTSVHRRPGSRAPFWAGGG